ncbi:SufE-like protein 2, chloroplastic [Linum perenne]
MNTVIFNPPNLSPPFTNRSSGGIPLHNHGERFIPRSRIRPILSSLECSFPPPREKKTDLSVHFATAECPPAAASDVGDRVRALVEEFAALTEPLDRVKRLLDYAGRIPPFEDSDRVDSNRVTGCTTQVWLEVRLDELGKARFRADSDSEITKGFVSCLVWVLDGASPEEVAAVEAEDLEVMNVGFNGKSPSRVKTWQNVLDSMKRRALDLKGKGLIGLPVLTAEALAGSLPPA